jgi:hypothetical protein
MTLEKPSMGMVSLLLFALNGGGSRGRGGAQGRDEGATTTSNSNGSGVGERLLTQDGAPARAGSFLEHQTNTERQLSTVADADNEVVAMATPQIDNHNGGGAAAAFAAHAPRDR